MKKIVFGAVILCLASFVVYLSLEKRSAKPRSQDVSYGVIAHYKATAPSKICIKLLLQFAESRAELKTTQRTSQLNSLNKQTRNYREAFQKEGCDDRWALEVIRAQEREL